MPSRAVLSIFMVLLAGCAGAVPLPQGTEYRRRLDDETGWVVHELRSGTGTPREMRVLIVPAAGATARSFRFGDVELLHAPGRLKELPESGGIALLYPTPGRVDEGKFTFEGVEFEFPRNGGRHHRDGLVRDVPWEARELEVEDGALRLPLVLEVEPGDPIHERFPFRHRLEVAYVLDADGLHIDFEIKNLDTRRLPFGLGVRPYFRLLGEREHTYITVPARRHLATGPFDGLPTGRLRPLDGIEEDVRGPVSLSGLRLDDAYWGMDPRRSARWEARDRGIAATIEASEIFTQVVVETPPGKDWFMIGSRTSSGDAHNLYARDAARTAHLLILEPVGSPGSTVEGRVSFIVEQLDEQSSGIANAEPR